MRRPKPPELWLHRKIDWRGRHRPGRHEFVDQSRWYGGAKAYKERDRRMRWRSDEQLDEVEATDAADDLECRRVARRVKLTKEKRNVA